MSQTDCSQFFLHILQDCQKAGFPCIPDVENPVVSIYYIAACWMGHTDDHSVKEIIDTAQQRGLIRCTIRRQPCIRITDSREIILATSERSESRAHHSPDRTTTHPARSLAAAPCPPGQTAGGIPGRTPAAGATRSQNREQNRDQNGDQNGERKAG